MTSNPTLKRDCAKARSPLAPRWALKGEPMKLAIFFLAVIFCGNTFAQQPPGAPPLPTPPMFPPAVPPAAIPKAVPRAPEFSNQELTALLRAQTAAIKSLSSKLDSLEERLGKIEKGRQ